MISDYADNCENCQGAEKIADALKDNRSITTIDLVKETHVCLFMLVLFILCLLIWLVP
jgi:hypothetical protein